ncbi:VPS20 (YMR077C) [Zygosaccharomyces parabailii]|uniref:ZYBA0S13-02520g1_1 n=1 Tax=Zygosaccharomyces bailii (strain CLIB 213 / ATCC 58445 / CBS 680 / BCRC 21525 / NBRC 1098 / NCYC 1416 / NRRL Y-2227) TaxID=1333698 RepID=A0A8J2TC98_ZYGB2|nr:VPS20 (YMR077C) [Zygosaccharomyces parabailii]CDF91742.1 ZYBA0S13-02520g1_1 [Zygosaccharomyces bailii CLIB 213]CDH12350.1 related to Vacuolar protein sorting-associated protein 20 [Zygosaccharomyces bailii ISA1307]SJM87595.1 related to Vacuolar protein sorting-associated protein 20 [Zygosaccharomyces bailii]
MGQKPSKVKITENDRAILQLKRSKDEIHKFAKRTDKLIASENARLKSMIQEDPQNYKNNPKIRFLLKRIHYQNHLLEQAGDQLINLENLVSTLEFKVVELQFVKGLERGNVILTKLNKEFKGAEQLMDNVQAQVSYQDEINDVLARSVVGVNDFEAELDKELDELEQEVNPERYMPSTEGLPSLKAPAKQASEEHISGDLVEERLLA